MFKLTIETTNSPQQAADLARMLRNAAAAIEANKDATQSRVHNLNGKAIGWWAVS